MVWVRPGKLPANVMVAPNSPRARAQHSAAPAATDGRTRGTVMCRKTVQRFAPSVGWGLGQMRDPQAPGGLVLGAAWPIPRGATELGEPNARVCRSGPNVIWGAWTAWITAVRQLPQRGRGVSAAHAARCPSLPAPGNLTARSRLPYGNASS